MGYPPWYRYTSTCANCNAEIVVPSDHSTEEQKSKPWQHAVQQICAEAAHDTAEVHMEKDLFHPKAPKEVRYGTTLRSAEPLNEEPVTEVLNKPVSLFELNITHEPSVDPKVGSTIFPKEAEPGTLFLAADKKLYYCTNGKWNPAHQIQFGNETAAVRWLNERGYTRVAWMPGQPYLGTMGAFVFHSKVATSRVNLAFHNDILVDEGGVFGVQVHGSYPNRGAIKEVPSQEDTIVQLKLSLEEIQCIRAALIELAERKHPTTDWQRAGELYEKITKKIQTLLGVSTDDKQEEEH